MTRRILVIVSMASVALAMLAGCSTAGSPATPTTATATATPKTCKRTSRVVIINLDNRRHARVLDHAWDAIDEGQPLVLTLERTGADQRREVSTDDLPTRKGFDRDEYPVATSAEGGESASVRYVESSENRSAGSIMGAKLRPYCDGAKFRYEKRPR